MLPTCVYITLYTADGHLCSHLFVVVGGAVAATVDAFKQGNKGEADVSLATDAPPSLIVCYVALAVLVFPCN